MPMNKKNYIMFRAYGAEQTLCLNPVKSIAPTKKFSKKSSTKPTLFKSLLIVVLLFSVILTFSAYADDVIYPAAENNGWEIIEYDNVDMITLTKEGDITVGDRLFFILYPKDGCKSVDVGFFVYSEKKIEDYKQLLHKTFVIKVGNFADYEYMNAYIVANDEFLDGFRSFLALGSYGMDQLLRGFGTVDTMMVEFINADQHLIQEVGLEQPDDLLVNDYFDITKNVWAMHNFNNYIVKAQSVCKSKLQEPEATAKLLSAIKFIKE